jgi:hypothetical protein
VFHSFANLVEPLTKGLPPPDPRSLYPLSSTEFVESPPPWKKFLGTPLHFRYGIWNHCCYFTVLINVILSYQLCPRVKSNMHLLKFCYILQKVPIYMLLETYDLERFDYATPEKIRKLFQNASPMSFIVFTILICSPHS